MAGEDVEPDGPRVPAVVPNEAGHPRVDVERSGDHPPVVVYSHSTGQIRRAHRSGAARRREPRHVEEAAHVDLIEREEDARTHREVARLLVSNGHRPPRAPGEDVVEVGGGPEQKLREAGGRAPYP